MLTADFDYHLPPELIASEPLIDRAASRMLVVNRATGEIAHRSFREIGDFVSAENGDLLVLNDTRVVLARFFTDQGHEILRLQALTPKSWRCMVRPGRKFRIGHSCRVGGATGTVVEILEPSGNRVIEWDNVVDENAHGHLALPHYMGRDDRPADRERYQTVFAAEEGSIAAPTAGLHFTPEILSPLPHAFVTLHVGVGTFQPVKAEKIEDHVMHREEYEISTETAAQIQAAQRVVCVGTTSLRTLESVVQDQRQVTAGRGSTDIFIYPGYEFQVADGLLTNFHLPKSTLMMLVSAFAGSDLIRAAYEEAIREKYRFYSYGDCMLIV